MQWCSIANYHFNQLFFSYWAWFWYVLQYHTIFDMIRFDSICGFGLVPRLRLFLFKFWIKDLSSPYRGLQSTPLTLKDQISCRDRGWYFWIVFKVLKEAVLKCDDVWVDYGFNFFDLWRNWLLGKLYKVCLFLLLFAFSFFLSF